MPPLETFTCFPLLPAELRLRIWHHTFEPREIDHGMLYDFYQSRPPPPAALHINHESRTETLALYTMLNTWGRMTRPWLSPTLDTVCVCFSTFPGAPHFIRLAAENPEFHKSAKKVEVWCQDLQTCNDQVDFMLRHSVSGKRSLPNYAWVPFGGVDEMTFIMDEKIGKKGYGAFLEKLRVWYGIVKGFEGELLLDIKMPRVLKVVGRAKNELAVLTDGVLVVTAAPAVAEVKTGTIADASAELEGGVNM